MGQRRRRRRGLKDAGHSSGRENPAEGEEGVPVAGGGGAAQEFFNDGVRVEFAGFARATNGEGELAHDGDQLDDPAAAGRKFDGERGDAGGGAVQDGDEFAGVGGPGNAGERVGADEVKDPGGGTDDQVGLEREMAEDFGAEAGGGNARANHPGAGGAEVDDVEGGQVFGEGGGFEALVAADIDGAEKNDGGHRVGRVESRVRKGGFWLQGWIYPKARRDWPAKFIVQAREWMCQDARAHRPPRVRFGEGLSR